MEKRSVAMEREKAVQEAERRIQDMERRQREQQEQELRQKAKERSQLAKADAEIARVKATEALERARLGALQRKTSSERRCVSLDRFLCVSVNRSHRRVFFLAKKGHAPRLSESEKAQRLAEEAKRKQQRLQCKLEGVEASQVRACPSLSCSLFFIVPHSLPLSLQTRAQGAWVPSVPPRKNSPEVYV